MVVWPGAGEHWDYFYDRPRGLVRIDTQYINKGDFDRWLAGKNVLIDKSWFELPWVVYRVYVSTLSLADMKSRWGVPITPAPSETVPSPIPEETMEFWQEKGFTEPQAAHIAKWCRDNQMSPSPSTIEKIIAELEPVTETALSKAWREFAANPDILTGLGLLPSAVIESFSRVFTGHSYIDDKPAEPRPGDWVGVASILAGVATATLGVALHVIGAGTGYVVPGLAGKFTTVSSTTYAPRALSGAALNSWTAAQTAATPASFSTAAKATSQLTLLGAKLAPASTGGVLSALMSNIKANPLLAILVLTQADIIAWALGISPEHTHEKVEQTLKNANSHMWSLEDAIKNQDWETGKVLVGNLRSELKLSEDQMMGWSINVFDTLGFTKNDLELWSNTTNSTLEAYIAKYPQLSGLAPTFPSEFTIDSAQVEDGDTLIWAGHPEAQEKIRVIGIDAHESETAAGKEETAYLKSLIEGKKVTIKTHQYGTPEMTLDIYGRLLGGVFLDGKDVALAMLEHFGTSILVATKYQDKYRWIDWDEYTRAAKAAKGPAVQEFKIFIESEPSNAKLYIDGAYTHHLTPSDEAELADVMDLLAPGEHIIKAVKSGKEASIKTTIHSGANENIILTLKAAGLTPEAPVEVPAEVPQPITEEPDEFTINILSTPSRAKLYIDGEYTHHLTPSNEKELSDVMHLLTPGEHVLRATKGGKATEKKITVLPGHNEPIYLTLEVVGLPSSKEDLLAQIQGYQAIIEQLQAELSKLG
jgi:endonuclease YncB( thermonuclease family)